MASSASAGGVPSSASNPACASRRRAWRATGAPVSTKAQAFYLEDNWNVTDNLLLNLGVRFDNFKNTLASGATLRKRGSAT